VVTAAMAAPRASPRIMAVFAIAGEEDALQGHGVRLGALAMNSRTPS
jgi:hypothetical protein